MNKKRTSLLFQKNNFIIRYYNYFYNFLFKKINNIQLDKNENKNLVEEKIKSLNTPLRLILPGC